MAKPFLSAQDAASHLLDVRDGDLIRSWDHPLTTYSIGVKPDLTFIESISDAGKDVWDWVGPGQPNPNIVSISSNTNFNMIEEAFELWDDVIGHNMVRNNSASSHITLNFIDNVPAGSGGYTRTDADFIEMPGWYPNIGDNKLNQADIYVPTTTSTTYASFDNAFSTFVHEIGHSLGLRHPGDYDASDGPADYNRDATFAQDTDQYSVMSYFSAKALDPGIKRTSIMGFEVQPQTPMVHDIVAIQSIPSYGVDTTTRTGNTTYGFFTTPDIANRQVFNFDVNTNPYLTIWDAGGTDTLNVSRYGTNQKIDLNPGAYSNIGPMTQNVGIAYGTWIENAVGGSGHDEIFGNSRSNSLTGNGGIDRMFGGGGKDYLFGGTGDDHLFGGTENDFLYGEDNNDTLNGEAGADVMLGGFGNDVYVVDDYGDDVVDVAAANGGLDKVYTTLAYFDLRASDTGAGWVEELQFVGPHLTTTGHGNQLQNALIGGIGNDTLYGYEGHDTLAGGRGIDTLDGGTGNDWLYGEDGNDILIGGSGEDTLIGGGGADDMQGGSGRDTYYVDNTDDKVIEGRYLRLPGTPMVDNTDTVIAFADFKLGNYVENLTLEGLAYNGEGNDLANVITGSNLDNALFGYGGNDTLNGGEGADYMEGGKGNDTYHVDNLGDEVFEYFYVPVNAPVEQTDWVYASVDNYSLTDNVEHLLLQGGAITGSGNGIDNIIMGTAGNNRLFGNGGNDTLMGGLGADYMSGGTGNDIYYVDNAGDVVYEYNRVLPHRHVSGTDLVYSTIADYKLGGYVENLSLLAGGVNGTGNLLSNIIVGNDGANRLTGLDGDDTLTGGGNADTFVYGNAWGKDTITDFAVGQDRLDMRGVNGLTSFSQLTIGDTGAGVRITFGADTITLSGVTKAQLTAASFQLKPPPPVNQSFDGTLYWGGTIAGGAGNDTVSYANADVMIHIDLDSGIAQAQTAAPVTAHLTSIENVTGASNMMNWIYADARDNVLIGGDLYDWLEGRGGSNTLDGRGGSDTADYLNTAKPLTINLSTGTVTHSTGVDKVSNIENFRGTNYADTFIGDAADNIFYAMYGDDVANGGAGNDTLDGSGGNDTLSGGAGRNKLLGGEGDDTLIGGSEYDWAEGGSGNDTFTGTGGSMVMFGGEGNDRMTGSLDVYNYIDGGNGNDQMTGGSTDDYIADVAGGDDTMHGGGGNDTLVDFYGASQLYGEAGNDFVTAAGGSGLLDGGAGKDYISVANGNYVLVGGAGDDTLEAAGTGSHSFTGGAGADIFTYRVGGDQLRIVTDFEDGVDHIHLWDNQYYGNVPFTSLTITDSEAGAVISWNGGSEMVLAGIAASQITQDDFLLVV